MRSHAKAVTAGSIEKGRGAPSLGLVALCFVAAALLAGLHGASTAQAANSFVPSGEISAGELTGPARIAVDEATGNVLVVDSAKNRVDVFESSGSGAGLLTTFGEADLSGPYGIAIDQSNGDVYVTDPGNEQILRYTTDGAPTPTYTLDAGYTGPAAGTGPEEVGSFASAIAVDPTNANLLVADRGNDRVSRFSVAGAFVSSFNGADSTDGAFTHLEDVTLSPAGKVFVTDGEAAAGGPSRVLRFSNAGAYEATLRAPTASGDGYLAYDANHTELLVGDARECFFCNVSVHVLDPASGAVLFDVSVPAEQITGLASDPTSGRLYIARSKGFFFGPPNVEVFAPQMHPELVLDAPGPIGATSAHLSGTVDPGGVATEYHFEVSKDGGATWLKSPEPDASAGEGTSPVAVETDFTVEPNTEYVARLVATNTDGAQDATPTQAFVTEPVAPGVNTALATDLGETTATIRGTINPFGLQTTYYFEYGPTAAYGSRIPVDIDGVAGNGRVTKSFSRIVPGLSPGTTYHFRLVATNSVGTTQGGDQTFTTVTAGTDPARAYEQVTPPDKKGATVIAHFGFQARSDGDALTYLSKSGPESSPLWSRWTATRGSGDWGDHAQTDPPLNVYREGPFLVRPTLAISDDFTHALVASNRALTPGAVENEMNLYVRDLRSRSFRLIAPLDRFPSQVIGTGADNMLQAAAPDFSWIVFASPAPLLPGAPAEATYRWSESDGLEIVSVLPNGEMTRATRGDTYVSYKTTAEDGSRTYFSTLGGAEEGVFLREGNVTKPVSVSEVPGEPTGPQAALLFAVNPSGRYAFFINRAPGVKLTSDAPGLAAEASGDLYRYDAVDDSVEYLGASAVFTGPGNVISGSLGVSDDGNTFYFANAEGGFYVWREGALQFISASTPHLPTGEGHISPSGRYYFYYQKQITPEVNWLALYDAVTDELSCVTCLPDGTPVPGQLPNNGVGDSLFSNKYSHAVDDDGTVYFDSSAALVAADVNNNRDVYTYRDGRFTLISPGNGPFAASYGSASEDGQDIFFTTAQKLVGRDDDQSVDVYDARVNGGLPAQSDRARTECLGADCEASAEAAPESTGDGSEALVGPGNVKPVKKPQCGRGKHRMRVKGKTRCVKSKANKQHRTSKTRKGGAR